MLVSVDAQGLTSRPSSTNAGAGCVFMHLYVLDCQFLTPPSGIRLYILTLAPPVSPY